ncbi:MAG: hypothetical protein GW903_03090 [Alphaproteobacteria bacterium]|nr:hypothetical protein [Alphaproteobacteria bacterium]NCQ87955.1 hypothetical protein [Alphaproteobacteria bacterium]NCT05538.1 hypothetical protein [Alphaproteobacteria bacterium]
MDFSDRVELITRTVFMGRDWRISASNPARLLDFPPKGLTKAEIERRVNERFDSGNFPVKVWVETPQGKRLQLSRIFMIPDDAVCTGQSAQKGQRFLTFDLTR